MMFASFNGGNPVIGLLLLPLFFGGPFLLIWLNIRAFLKSEAQSILILLLIVVLGALAGFYAIGSINEFGRTLGFWKTHLIAAWIGAAGFPVAAGWEVYKQGWLSKWVAPTKKKQRRQEDWE